MLSRALKTSLLVSLLIFITVVANAQDFVTNGLLAFWTFDKNTVNGDVLKDVLGKNNGKIIGAPKSVPGKINEAIEFNGTTDYIELPDMGNEEAVSVEVWVDAVAGGTLHGLVSTFGVDLWIAGVVHFKYEADLGQLTADRCAADKIRTDMEADQWCHAMYTCDTKKNELKLYLNGELVAQGASGAEPNNLTRMRIASEYDGRFFQGVLDEVRIYNRVLDDAEVEKNFKSKSNTLAVNPAGRLTTFWSLVKQSTY